MQERKIIALLRERGRAGAARPAGTRWAAVRYVIVPILRDPQEREECLSEVTLRVWEKIDTFQEERGSWNGWLTSLTRHAALNHARRISRHGGAEALSEDPPSPELTPEEVLLRQERQTALGTNLWGLNYLLPGIGLVLMLLGFRLLWREEIEACRGAIQMVVSVQEFDQKGGFCRSSGSNPLCITGVRVKLTGEPAGWMIFHHSLWNTAPPFHGTAAIQLCRYTSRMSCGAPPERSPAGFCTIGTGRPSGRPTTLWRRIPPPTDIRASMDSGTFSGHFLCPLRRSTGGAMWSMPPMKFLTQNTEMCRIAGSITAIRTDFCNTRQKRHWKTGCPIMGHFGPSGAICATAPK